MSAAEHPREGLQLVKDISKRGKSQPKVLRKIFLVREGEEADALDGGGMTSRSFSRVSGARKETLWLRTSLEVSKGKFILAGLTTC